jgi:hypothetical protein
MFVHNLPVSMSQRPKMVTPELAEVALYGALSVSGGETSQREHYERKWIELLSEMGESDRLWIFETSGIGAHQRTGLAREQGGKVVDILMFP